MAEKKTGLDVFLAAMPLEREFKIVMVADSTVETGVEIDTDIAAGSKVAWAILGLRYSFEKVAAPHVPHAPGASASASAVLQLVRGELPTTPVFIGRHNHDLIGEDHIEVSTETAVGSRVHTWPREVPFRGVTQLPKLHLTFGTSADWTGLSDATNRLAGVIIYNLVTAPPARHEDL